MFLKINSLKELEKTRFGSWKHVYIISKKKKEIAAVNDF